MSRISIIVHGGAGDIAENERALHIRGLQGAVEAGWQVLRARGSALDAVEAAVKILEDDPVFDAGVGSVLRLDGSIGLDASIMDGANRRAGAVAGLTQVRHPILLARRVLERTEHVLLMGAGAEAFARLEGLEMVPATFFVTARERERLERILRQRAEAAAGPQGTVGAVALDAAGHLAAATSTGGASGALPGRVGDSPIVGAGTYADDRQGAACATGRGENMIRVGLTRELVRMLGQGKAPAEAARWACDFLRAETGGTGGVICLGPSGTPGSAFTTPWMGCLCREEEL